MDRFHQPMQNSMYSTKGGPVAFNPMMGNQGNFQTVFNPLPNIQSNGYDPKGQFMNHNFANQNAMLHNNLSNILLNEEIREYSVMIDSKDRNYQVYPDPFSYEVKFHPLPKSKEKINGKYVTYEEPAPTINDNFKNVRYIKLEEVLLPLYNRVKTVVEEDDDGDTVKTWKVDTNKPITDNLYTVLSLGSGYADENYKSTNDVLSDSFATIYFDCKANNTHYFGCTANGIKIFPQDQLGTIDKLKISFMDPYGQPLRCVHVDKNIKSNMVCTCEDPEGDDETDCFKHNLFHPLNPIFQHHLHFKVGVVEPRLNKLTFN
ncbi:hypothetical protein QJ856_gp0873 [Tupanvirus deep ocean]|uniref:Uncharacterized protein n=2 Tax=Tupanvirus TaxID=2094720 RepID=A0AC62A896_9VIRU|nr:hypothetical protein QJ856_gp0873 [Tupanvirus deep ocean]QKU33882.1 hypothetical protein [Tupanvirus deep ocean]